MTDKRYQVFVSSTYEDLKVERQEIMQALLALNCIPSGMELFPAADETQWDLIQRVIDDCDYYILIVAGRYGSLGKDGRSYTEMEYDYAIKAGKPTLTFVHSEPEKLESGKCESTDKGRENLAKFRLKLREKLYKGWSHSKELKGEVAVSIGNLIKSKPATGWVRANEAISSEAAIEINKLRGKIEDLTSRLNTARTTAPTGAQELAQGTDAISVKCRYDGRATYNQNSDILATWNALFEASGPSMLQEASDSALRTALDKWAEGQLKSDKNARGYEPSNVRLLNDSFNQIKVQFIALGLIQKSEKPRSIKDAGTFWSLSPYGEQMLMNLLAVRRN